MLLSGSAGKGIFQLLSQIEEDQKKPTERISRIRDRYAQQRESAEKHLTFAINQTNKVLKILCTTFYVMQIMWFLSSFFSMVR